MSNIEKNVRHNNLPLKICKKIFFNLIYIPKSGTIGDKQTNQENGRIGKVDHLAKWTNRECRRIVKVDRSGK